MPKMLLNHEFLLIWHTVLVSHDYSDDDTNVDNLCPYNVF